MVLQTKGKSEQLNAIRRFQNPRSGWKHKAWGGAERNPRITKVKKAERAKRAAAERANLLMANGCRRASRALPLFFKPILGFRFASPQAVCCRPLRGLLTWCRLRSLAASYATHWILRGSRTSLPIPHNTPQLSFAETFLLLVRLKSRSC